ncbi:lytic transglycosylase domain-containing protein [Candidatus Uhrbacteria bacterium]|nr:lytic transglycosylase domain-containing protein [Candidatus Uhrbacteria bacterium]
MNRVTYLFVFVIMLGASSASTASAQYDAYIREASVLYSLPEAFIRAVIRTESNFHPTSRSSAGAVGLMQLMPATARSMGVTDRYDPYQSIMGGCRYLRLLANRYGGNLALTLAAYNAGPGSIIRAGGFPPSVTGYVNAVLRHYRSYAGR